MNDANEQRVQGSLDHYHEVNDNAKDSDDKTVKNDAANKS